MTQEISIALARKIAIEAAGLSDPRPSGIAGSLSQLKRAGSVQIDTISIVERAHHHILWSRVEGYAPSHLPILEEEPRKAIEYWSHAAAYMPIEEYRFCLPRMERIKARGHHWFNADPDALDYVKSRISFEGPLRAQDFSEPMKGKRGWWDWKPAKVALEYLFHTGELIATTRRGFQKVYDLSERALPKDLDLRFPTPTQQADRHIDRAVSAQGIFSRDEIAYMREDGTEGIDEALAKRVASGSLVETVIIDETYGSRAKAKPRLRYASPSTLEQGSAERPGSPSSRALILSPFDPLIIDRRRMFRIFGFEYQLECYLPEAKRAFGYFALPLLYIDELGNGNFAGLLDAKVDRKGERLTLRRASFFPPSRATRAPAAFARAVAQELRRYALFNGASRIEIDCLEAGSKIAACLRAAVKRVKL